MACEVFRSISKLDLDMINLNYSYNTDSNDYNYVSINQVGQANHCGLRDFFFFKKRCTYYTCRCILDWVRKEISKKKILITKSRTSKSRIRHSLKRMQALRKCTL